ncbi:TonB-dependent receptor [Marinilabiliaceae bacterium JC017]|nr:TonB-dependent receptor [Marinilabiliaceae bacterium JC017]
MKRRVIVALFFVVLAGNALADELLKDTVKVKEVLVTCSRQKHLSDGYRILTISPQKNEQFAQRTMAEMLQYSSNLNINSYGSPGASASLSLRGTGASHTQVNWNGFPVNSVTLGSADLSVLSLNEQQDVSIVYGASGALYGSGTFGGAVNLDSRADYSVNGFKGNASLAYGSMNTYKGAFGYQAGNEKLHLNGTVWGDQSDGDFEYYDDINEETLNRKNADYHQYGISQNFFYKLPQKASLSAGVWYQVKDLNLPSIMGSSPDNCENQKDSVLRTFVQYNKSFYRSTLQVKGAWFSSYQRYYQKSSPQAEDYLIDSRIKSDAWFADVNYRIFLSEEFSADLGSTFNYTTADVDAYQEKKAEHTLGLLAALKYYSEKVRGNITIRQDWSNTFSSDLLGNIGISFMPMGEDWGIRAAFSQKFRKPTFNDLFWVPGGNPDLKPERGYSSELGTNYSLNAGKAGQFTFDLSYYYTPIENMIAWRPDGALWYAENYFKVLTEGVDISVDHKMLFGKVNLHSGISLSYNDAVIEETTDNNEQKEGQPLYYAPKWLSNAFTEVSRDKWHALVSWRFTSKRYYDDNYTLDPYWLLNANVGYSVALRDQMVRVSGSVDNILNASYQSVRSYPMPGRTFQIRLKYSF